MDHLLHAPSALTADVVIVGCGPVGALAANLLGTYGVRTLVIERDHAEHGEPRAFSCDDEGLRIYQRVGLAAQLRADMVECGYIDYTGVNGQPFAQILLDGLDFGSGYGAVNFFYQPKLERVLRDGLARFAHVRFERGWSLEALEQNPDCVALTVSDGSTKRQVRARYVLGCDGARSTVRHLSGIAMNGTSYEERWLAVSGFAPPEALRLTHSRYVCDPRRPTFVGRGALGDYRMEFMLQGHETAAEMEHPAMIERLVAPYVDPAEFQITRAVVYKFHNVVADRWQDRRVFLVGDAAHQMPPMMGQGLVSGLRDAGNLAWKLALVLRDGVDETILRSYEVERRPHAKQMADISAKVAALFLTRQRSLALLRDRFFVAVQRIPRVRRFIQHLEFKPPAAFGRGLIMGGQRRTRTAPEGTLFPQYEVTTPEGTTMLLDEVLGPGFAVVGMHADPRLLDAQHAQVWRSIGGRLVLIIPAGHPALPSMPGVQQVFDTTGKIAAWFQRHRVQLAIVRPDRYVFGAGTAAEAPRLVDALILALPRRTTPDDLHIASDAHHPEPTLLPQTMHP